MASKSPDTENVDLQRMQADSRWGVFYTLPFRAVSLLAALALTALVLVYPNALASDTGQANHGLLSLLMTGISAGFVHGSGFVPRLWVWRLLFSPLVAWSLMAWGAWSVYLNA